MSRRIPHIACLCLAILTLYGCDDNIKNLELSKWQVTLKKEDKKPYGTYLAYNSLKSFFPGSRIVPLSTSYRFSSISGDMQGSIAGRNLMILSGLDFYLSDREWDKLQLFVRNGNELMIFCNKLDPKIQNALNFSMVNPQSDLILYDLPTLQKNRDILSIAGRPARYGYTGKTLGGYFIGSGADNNDTTNDYETTYTLADTLGYSGNEPNCIRISMGRGHITLHAAPLSLSNYFLLQNGNIDYLSAIWQSLPSDIDHVYWDDYGRHSSQDNSVNALFQHPATRWAIWLSIFTFAVYIVFQMKRRQRIIPVIPPLRNDSVSFVETVGRLYYNKGDNHNLAEKMVQQFLEWVRGKYYINTNLLNDDFTRQLAIKSGQPEVVVSELANMIHEVRLRDAKIDDPYLYQLYNTIQQFYKNHHR